ncbi:MAG: SPOR domain-containing protein [Prevotella sp.]|nr:SPOR domain-containing protein [Prevotella sp.]
METSQYQFMRKVLVVLPFYLFTFLPLSAQTFTQRIQKQAAGQGTVTIHQSDSIDALVNSTVLSANPGGSSAASNSGSSAASNTPSAPAPADKRAQQASNAKSNHTAEPQDVPDESTAKPGPVRKAMGYRVQAFAGGNSRADRQQAERIRNNIKAVYPSVPVYVHFRSPRWICQVGNYRNYEEAHQMLVSLRNMGFDQSYIVKGKITVTN